MKIITGLFNFGQVMMINHQKWSNGSSMDVGLTITLVDKKNKKQINEMWESNYFSLPAC